MKEDVKLMVKLLEGGPYIIIHLFKKIIIKEKFNCIASCGFMIIYPKKKKHFLNLCKI